MKLEKARKREVREETYLEVAVAQLLFEVQGIDDRIYDRLRT